MKILQIINSMATGGAEKLLLETIPLYRKEKIEMDILVLNDQDYPFMKELRSKNCCKIFSLGNGSVYNPVNIVKIIPYLKKYDCIHVHLFPAQYWVVLAKILSFSKVKLIFTEHNTSNRRLENGLLRKIDKKIYKFYDRIVCITKEIRIILLEHTGLSQEKFALIENGVNLQQIQEAKPSPKSQINEKIAEEDKLIIQVAGFREQKDQVTLIKAMSFLPSHIKLLLVGSGALLEECQQLAKDIQLQDRVFFLGLRMDVPQLLKASDIIVLSSKYEGLSLSSIEGMAAGKPFIASDVPGLTEIVKGYGVVFGQGNSKELAGQIQKLLDDTEFYNAIVRACQERASHFDISKMVENHIALYKLLGESAS